VSTAARAIVSESEFLALPESNQPIELVDGEVIVTPSPGYRHQEVLARMVSALRGWVAASGAEASVVQAPLDVRFGAGRILQPDAMVFLQALAADVATPVERIPEICIEVLSHNRAYDRVTKRYLYAEAGVQEYWIVDPAGMLERRSGPALSQLDEISGSLTSPLLAGFALDLEPLFRFT
jgi:Uma2 family endonuclease